MAAATSLALDSRFRGSDTEENERPVEDWDEFLCAFSSPLCILCSSVAPWFKADSLDLSRTIAMLLIDCPYCGPRNETEFRYGGESHIARPGPAPEVSDAVWADYMFNRTNSKGWHRERWCHVHGCGQWFNIARDTVTHAIIAIYRMGEPPPGERG